MITNNFKWFSIVTYITCRKQISKVLTIGKFGLREYRSYFYYS